jgi:hypothetical protein
VFPSGSVAWRFTKEKLFDNISWLSDGKIRYGYGAVGNNRIDNLLYLQLYGVTGQYAFNHSILLTLRQLRWLILIFAGKKYNQQFRH